MDPLTIMKLKSLLPYAIAVALGFAGAWYIQGIRITAEEQSCTEFKQAQTTKAQEAKDAEDTRRDKQSETNAKQKELLDRAISVGDTYKRCIDAGKCGRMRNPATCTNSTPGISAPAGTYAAGADSVPSTEGTPEVVADCSRATLICNQLQNFISGQPGYSR